MTSPFPSSDDTVRRVIRDKLVQVEKGYVLWWPVRTYLDKIRHQPLQRAFLVILCLLCCVVPVKQSGESKSNSKMKTYPVRRRH
jgi:hypothetical protein